LTRIGSGGARSNIKNDIVIGDCVGRDDPRWRVVSKGFANHQIDWHGDRPTLLAHDRYDRGRFADQPLDIVDYGRRFTLGLRFKY